MTPEEHAEQILIQMFAQAHAQFGHVMKGYWFYEPDDCPGCGRIVGAMQYKGKEAISVNGFIYRKRGILIGYLLCNRCANEIHRSAEKRPGVQIPRHDIIEKTLSAAYEAHMNRLDA
ncbi:MAG: hypothetical protein WAS33_06820 [Candidatus Promineifilaceae bacterium]